MWEPYRPSQPVTGIALLYFYLPNHMVSHSRGLYIYFKEYSDTEQSLTYPSEKLVETVGAAVTLMESMMAEVAHLNSVEQHITSAIKNKQH
jgi:hypothetical protein